MRRQSVRMLKNEKYKETELGLLPAYWDVVKVGEVFEFSRKPRDLEIDGDKDIPFIPMELISYKGELARWRSKKPPEISSGTFVLKNDLIVSKITPCFENGKQAILSNLPNDFGYATTEVWALHPKDGRVINEHLFAYLRIPQIRRDLAGKMEGTTGRQRLPKHVLANFLIPLPPLSEQAKIAFALSTIQQAREKTENAIKSQRELKKSLMKHLFTYGPVSLEDAERVKLKETEIGEIPEDWKVAAIESLAEVKGGKRLPKGHLFSSKTTQFPYLRIVDFANWSINKSNLKYLKSEDVEVLKRYVIGCDDVYISIAGTIGIAGTIPRELDGANLTENAAKLVIKDKKKLSKDYLVSYLASKSGQKEIDVRTTKTSQPKLALSRIKTIPVSLPSLHIQNEIASILSNVNEKIEKLENKKRALDELFKSMLHYLMTAKMSVKDLEHSVLFDTWGCNGGYRLYDLFPREVVRRNFRNWLRKLTKKDIKLLMKNTI